MNRIVVIIIFSLAALGCSKPPKDTNVINGEITPVVSKNSAAIDNNVIADASFTEEIIAIDEIPFIYNEPYDFQNRNWIQPHINIGVLTEVNYDDVINGIIKRNPIEHVMADRVEYLPIRRLDKRFQDKVEPAKAYKQYISEAGLTIYRLMFQFPNLDAEAEQNNQKRIYDDEYYPVENGIFQVAYFIDENNDAVLFYATFYHYFELKDGWSSRENTASNFMPFIKNNKFVGFMSYALYYDTDENGLVMKNYWTSDIPPYSSATVYLKEENAFEYYLEMDGSFPVDDEKKVNIFKYSLQNAFDGNPSTSYVPTGSYSRISRSAFRNYPMANFNNYGMHIAILHGRIGQIEKISMINGYAANTDLYYKNHRIKEVKVFMRINDPRDQGSGVFWGSRLVPDRSFVLSDNTLTKQIVENFTNEYPMLNLRELDSSSIHYSLLSISGFYRGTHYSDMCLAELDFMINGEWFFNSYSP